MAAAATAVRSSTPITASIGVVAANAATVSAHPARFAKSRVSNPDGLSLSIVLASSEATVTSSPRRRAADRKSGVR